MAKRAEVAAGRLVVVPPAQLRPHPENDNKQSPFMFGKLLSTIRSEGFSQPIVARSGDEKGPFPDGKLEILGGEQRWKAATQLKLSAVPVYDLGNVGATRARKLLVNLNKLHGDPDQDLLSKLVREIAADGEDALESLPFDEDTLRDFLDADAQVVLGEAPPPVADEDAGVVEVGAGVTSRDVLTALELSRVSKASLTELIETIRQWSFGRTDLSEPAWVALQRLLAANTRRPG